jgi:hypothetical protein
MTPRNRNRKRERTRHRERDALHQRGLVREPPHPAGVIGGILTASCDSALSWNAERVERERGVLSFNRMAWFGRRST